jgi:hypothetical protein
MPFMDKNGWTLKSDIGQKSRWVCLLNIQNFSQGIRIYAAMMRFVLRSPAETGALIII